MPPKAIEIDAGYSIKTEAWHAFSTSKMLDAWHLEQNRKRHVSDYQRSPGRGALAESMSNDFYVLRLFAAWLFRREEEVLKYGTELCPFAINKYYQLVYLRA